MLCRSSSWIGSNATVRVGVEVLAWVERNRDRLYRGPLEHGDIDMERGDHRPKPSAPAPF